MEPALVVQAQNGDQRAFDALARGLAVRFHSVAHRILQDPDLAQDATQQALISIWRDLPRLHDPSRFEAWSYRLLVRACYKEGAARRRWDFRSADVVGVAPVVPDATNTVVDHDRLQRGFARLSVEHRTVVVLHHYLGQTQGEVAETLGIPVETVRSRLRHAMRGLRAAIDADDRSEPIKHARQGVTS